MTSGGKTWQQWVWGSSNRTLSNGTVSYDLGKLIEAKRYNYPVGGNADWTVAESYEYQGALRALSRRVTQLQFLNNTGADKWGEAFEQSWSYNALGQVETVHYPECIPSPNATSRIYCSDGNDQLPRRPHTATWQYVQGTPTQVTSSRGPWAEYEYHPNLTFSRIGHNTGAEDVYDADPHGLARPRRIHIKRGSSTYYDTGFYQYDGAGNIWAIGADRYLYDQAGRLTEGGLTRFGSNRKELYSYDAFDNLLSLNRVSGPAPLNWNVDAKNRVRGPLNTTPDIFYDQAGNVLSVAKHTNGTPVFQFTYDALNMQSGFHRTNPDGTTAEDYLYVYGPGNYRFLVFRTDGANGVGANRTITLRGLDNKPLTRFVVTGFGAGAQWNWDQDSLHGANGIFAAIRSDGNTYHYHPDHLGSPRLLTNQSGAYLSERHYYPYGTEYIRFEGRPDDISAKFTGHERDPNGLTDYMLGRTYVYPLGRFASVDPARDGWNLYGYVGGNPISFTDPTGQERAQILLDQDNEALLAGEITPEEFQQRIQARGQGAITGATLFTPGPEELLIATAVKAGGRAVSGAASRVGAFFRKLLGKGDEAAELPPSGTGAPGGTTGVPELEFDRKLDFMFNRNIDPSKPSNAARARGNANRIGIADTPANRAEVTMRFNQAFNDPSSIVGPGNIPGSNLREFFLPGVTGTGSKVQFVELNGHVITIIVK